MKTVLLKTADLVEGYNPRKRFDIAELKESIKKQGVLVPLLVRSKDGKMEVVSGACRLKACKELEILEVSCIVKELSDIEAANLAYIDNKKRSEISPFDEAKHYAYMRDHYGYSAQTLADEYLVSKGLVGQYWGVARLPESFSQLNGLSMQHLYSLSKLSGKEDEEVSEEDLQKLKDEQVRIATTASENDWNVKRTEQEVQAALKRLSPAGSENPKKMDYAKDLMICLKRVGASFNDFFQSQAVSHPELLEQSSDKKKAALLSEIERIETSNASIDSLKTAIKRLKTGIQGDLELKD